MEAALDAHWPQIWYHAAVDIRRISTGGIYDFPALYYIRTKTFESLVSTSIRERGKKMISAQHRAGVANDMHKYIFLLHECLIKLSYSTYFRQWKLCLCVLCKFIWIYSYLFVFAGIALTLIIQKQYWKSNFVILHIRDVTEIHNPDCWFPRLRITNKRSFRLFWRFSLCNTHVSS